MANDTVTSDNLGDKIFSAAKTSFGNNYKLIQHFLEHESEKLAITLRMIIQASAENQITEAEAKILLTQQKIAASAILTSAEGITAVAVQAAIDASVNVIRGFVNGKIGFPLL